MLCRIPDAVQTAPQHITLFARAICQALVRVDMTQQGPFGRASVPLQQGAPIGRTIALTARWRSRSLRTKADDTGATAQKGGMSVRVPDGGAPWCTS